MDEIVFAASPKEVSCIIGNLFREAAPVCDGPDDGFIRFLRGEEKREYFLGADSVVVFAGRSFSEHFTELEIRPDRCIFRGHGDDLRAVRAGRCPEMRCRRG